MTLLLIFKNPHLKTYLWILEREEGTEVGRWGGGRERERERERERSMDLLPPECTPTGDLTCDPGMRPDWGIEPTAFGVWDDAPTH